MDCLFLNHGGRGGEISHEKCINWLQSQASKLNLALDWPLTNYLQQSRYKPTAQ